MAYSMDKFFMLSWSTNAWLSAVRTDTYQSEDVENLENIYCTRYDKTEEIFNGEDEVGLLLDNYTQRMF